MTVAVAKALEDGARRSSARRPGTPPRRPRPTPPAPGSTAVVLQPAGAVARGKLAQSRAVGAHVLEVRGSFDDALAGAASSRRGARTCSSTRSTRTASRARRPRVRDRRGARRAPGRARAALRRRRQHVRVRAGLHGKRQRTPRLVAGQASDRAGTLASAIRIAEPAHLDEVARAVEESGGEIVTVDDEEIIDAWLELASQRRPLLRALVGRGLAALAARRLEPGSTVVARHRPRRSRTRRPTCSPADDRRAGRGSHRGGDRGDVRVARRRRRPTSAPASTAPAPRSTSGTSSRSTEGDGEALDECPPAACERLRAGSRPSRAGASASSSRIPLERGLGSSAATIALGLVAGRSRPGGASTRTSCSRSALPLEGHADNLAAALARRRLPDLAEPASSRAAPTRLPRVPIASCPRRRVTAEARAARCPTPSRTPTRPPRPRRPRCSARRSPRATPSCFAAAFHDRLHEPYRAADAPLLEVVRADLPGARSGVTLSGSGPSRRRLGARGRGRRVAAELARRLPGRRASFRFAIADQGAHADEHLRPAVRPRQAAQRRPHRRRRPRRRARDAEGRRLHRRGPRASRSSASRRPGSRRCRAT